MSRQIAIDQWETLEWMVFLAQRAGAAAMTCYGVSMVVEFKTDSSPVTEADLASQKVIVEALIESSPYLVVSEESPLPDCLTEGTAFWLVDPLDGTKEFLAGNGEFTVNIALIYEGEPVLGVVHAPAIGLTYFAGSAVGSWKKIGLAPAERVHSSPPTDADELIVVESRSHPSVELEAFLAGLRVQRRMRVGSSLKFCLVADGTAHVYPRFGPTMAWDVAAGDCVFRNSGIDRPRSSPLRYGANDFRIGPFVLGLDRYIAFPREHNDIS